MNKLLLQRGWGQHKRHKATFWGDGYASSDCGDGFMGAQVCQYLSTFTFETCIGYCV